MTDNSNDNENASSGTDITRATNGVEPDAHGQAALLLAESILHALIETKTLTPAQALEVVQVAGEVKVDVALQTGESSKRMKESLALLAGMASSLATDLL